MKFVSISRLEPSMRLARPIYADDGRILLNAGVELSERYIERLRAAGFPGAYIATDYGEDIQYIDVICQETRQGAIRHLQSAFEAVRLGKTFDVSPIYQSVHAIIDEISGNPNVLVNLTDIRSYDNYTFAHSVNVCVISVILGLRFGLNELQLRDLAVGAILHDIGKTGIPPRIILKPGALTDEEMKEVQKHPSIGWQILRQHEEISLLSAHVAFQHHEQPNGQGYPRGLDESRITLFAKIVGVADAYDAMTSERVYRRGMKPAEALRVIKQLRGVQFCPKVADMLRECVAPYPVGSLVTLSSQDVGVVVDVNQAERSRPVVRLLYGANGQEITEYTEVDLAKEEYLSIIEVV